MRNETVLRGSGPARRPLRVLALGAALALGISCANPFDTSVENPNSVIESALGNPAGATTLVNGLGGSVTRALTAIYGPYHVTTDELVWSGSREFWKALDDGDISDPVNEYTDGAFPFVAEARWLANYTIDKVIAFDNASTLRNRGDLVRAHIYGAIIYITIGDMFDDFIIDSDRTVAGSPIGPANMQVMYDSAITFLDRALPVAVSLGNAELQRQVLGLRARAKHARAAWGLIRPARTVPVNPLVSDAGATADATAAIALMATNYRFVLTPTANNLAGINLGFEMNNRGELRAGATFMGPGSTATAPVIMNDPVTGTVSTTVTNAINACCRQAVANNVPMTMVSYREMRLILAEERLRNADDPGFLTQINLSRTVDGLPDYPDATNATSKLEYERKVQLFLQGRRLMDMYRFDVADPRWLTNSTVATNMCFLPISYIERLANPNAPQPNNARICQ